MFAPDDIEHVAEGLGKHKPCAGVNPLVTLAYVFHSVFGSGDNELPGDCL
jgi:hypothetical protein